MIVILVSVIGGVIVGGLLVLIVVVLVTKLSRPRKQETYVHSLLNYPADLHPRMKTVNL